MQICLASFRFYNVVYNVVEMRRFYTLFGVLFVPHVLGIVYIAHTDSSRLPPWAVRILPIYFLVALVVLAIWGRAKASPESVQPSGPVVAKRRRISRWGVAIYAIALINAIVLVASKAVPLEQAVPGLVVIVLMIGAYWWIGARSNLSRKDGG